MIDVVVPFHSKDRELLPWCIRSIHGLKVANRILIICHQSQKDYVGHVGGIFVDENFVDDLTAESYSHPRWNWYFQQIVKLGSADLVVTPYYLVVDSDTVFLRKVSFFNKEGRPLYAPATEFHRAYFDIFREVLGFHAHRQYSFTAHHMVYNRHIVKEMRDRFQPEAPWYKNIIRYVEPQPPWNSISQFNEQEVYGHYIKAVHPEEVNIRPLRWRNVNVLPNEQMFRQLARTFDFASFHAWDRKGAK